jgi:hypothetical protein
MLYKAFATLFRLVEITTKSISILIATLILVVVLLLSLSWAGREVKVLKQLPNLQSRFDTYLALHDLQDATLLSEHIGWATCGNSDGPQLPVVTRLYLSTTLREELESRYSRRGPIGLYFIDTSASRESPYSLPCFYYILFEGHQIPADIPSDKTLFVAYGFVDSITSNGASIRKRSFK